MRKFLIAIAMALLSVSLSSVAMGQGKASASASAEEVITKVREAARVLSKTHDLAQFDRKQSPWVWKDGYVFVIDCNKQTVVAHPLTPQLIGRSLGSIKDTKGNTPFPHPTRYCYAARRPSGVWIQYWWPKPGEKKDSRKLSYSLGAKGTPYIVGAGIYDAHDSIARLSKLTSKN